MTAADALARFIIAARDMDMSGLPRRERKRLQNLANDLQTVWIEYVNADVPYHPMPLDTIRSERRA